MNRNTRFWMAMALFQFLFALTVFALTRQYYMQDPDQINTRVNTTNQPAASWPVQSAESELEQLISAYPGQPTPSDPVAMAQQADEYFATGNYEMAGVLYEQLVSAGSDSVDLYNNLGITLHYLGRSSEALGRLNEGAAIDPGYQRIWLTLGFVNSQVGHTEQARSALKTAVQINAESQVGQSAAEMLLALDPE